MEVDHPMEVDKEGLAESPTKEKEPSTNGHKELQDESS